MEGKPRMQIVSQEILVETLRFKYQWLPWIAYPLLTVVTVFYKKTQTCKQQQQKQKQKMTNKNPQNNNNNKLQNKPKKTLIELCASYFLSHPYSSTHQMGEHTVLHVFSPKIVGDASFKKATHLKMCKGPSRLANRAMQCANLCFECACCSRSQHPPLVLW